MTQARRSALSEIMALAWRIFGTRHVPGCNVSTFADALRSAWAWIKHRALPPVAAGPVLKLRTMVQSPIRRSLTGKVYAYSLACDAGRLTSRMGA